MKVAIIGAGKTGRGFIGRLLWEAACEITFIDSNKDLINNLQFSKEYRVSFFGEVQPPVLISSFISYHTSNFVVPSVLADMDLIFVSVGVNNFYNVAKIIVQAILVRQSGGDNKKLVIVTAENAIEPAQKMKFLIGEEFGIDTIEKLPVVITESVIFCTTIESSDPNNDIISEKIDELPFDCKLLNIDLNLPEFMNPNTEFALLLKRKIFTYNCASAAIAYLGSFLGYSLYGEAANDSLVENVLSHLYDDISLVLCKEYGFTEISQKIFAKKSLKKFQNKDITDSIDRNTRDTKRKLSPDERMIGPLLLFDKYGINSPSLSLVVATALFYLIQHDQSFFEIVNKNGIEKLLFEICKLKKNNIMFDSLVNFYLQVASGVSLRHLVLQIK